jgi:hypothetical protein
VIGEVQWLRAAGRERLAGVQKGAGIADLELEVLVVLLYS